MIEDSKKPLPPFFQAANSALLDELAAGTTELEDYLSDAASAPEGKSLTPGLRLEDRSVLDYLGDARVPALPRAPAGESATPEVFWTRQPRGEERSGATLEQYLREGSLPDMGGGIILVSGGTGVASELLWTFPGTVSDDQNANIPLYVARRSFRLAKFYVKAVTPAVGGTVTIGWYKNGALVSTSVMAAGADEAESSDIVDFGPGDELRPQIDGMTTTEPPTTLTMQAR